MLFTIKNLEWIPFENFKNVTYITRGGFGKIYSAEWPEGCINCWDIENQKWKRINKIMVALKSLDNSSCISTEFLNEVIKIFIYLNFYSYIIHAFIYVFYMYLLKLSLFNIFIRLNLIFKFIFMMLFDVMG
jgi:hypothetical protein